MANVILLNSEECHIRSGESNKLPQMTERICACLTVNACRVFGTVVYSTLVPMRVSAQCVGFARYLILFHKMALTVRL